MSATTPFIPRSSDYCEALRECFYSAKTNAFFMGFLGESIELVGGKLPEYIKDLGKNFQTAGTFCVATQLIAEISAFSNNFQLYQREGECSKLKEVVYSGFEVIRESAKAALFVTPALPGNIIVPLMLTACAVDAMLDSYDLYELYGQDSNLEAETLVNEKTREVSKGNIAKELSNLRVLKVAATVVSIATTALAILQIFTGLAFITTAVAGIATLSLLLISDMYERSMTYKLEEQRNGPLPLKGAGA